MAREAERSQILTAAPPARADDAPAALAPQTAPGEPMIFGLIFALMAIVFTFDIFMPHDDVSIPFLYAIPVFVTIFSDRWSPYPFAVLATLLSAVGAFIQTPGESLDLVFFTNRAIAVLAQWLVAFLVRARKDSEALMLAEFEEEKRKVETSRRFMDVLSHEIGNSLTLIDGQAFRMKKLAESNEPLDAAVRADKIRQSVRHIESVVRQVQLASEVGEGLIYFRPVAVPLAALVTDSVQAQTRSSIHTDLSKLPVTVWGDADMLKQIIDNLLSNAIKYSPSDSLVEVIGRTEQDSAVLSITDHGRGIPDDEKAKLTEPYYRGRNSHGVHGAGIGLYVTKRFVSSHGGSIDIDSKLDVGTTVTIRIPIGQPPSEESRAAAAHPLH